MNSLSNEQQATSNKQRVWPDPVSIVVPAYNEEKRILPSLKVLTAFCETHFRYYEIICVDDGSTDRTWNMISQVRNDPFLRILRLPKNRGKGYAVKHGMLHAGGRFRFFTDADLPYSLDAFIVALKTFNTKKCDLVTGARELAGSSHVLEVGAVRRAAGLVFSAIATRLVNMDVSDSQCGFKGFTDHAAQRIFSGLQIPGYAFDVEIFALANAWNMKVCKIPVTLVKNDGSKIRLTRDPFCMFFDLLKIVRRNRMIG